MLTERLGESGYPFDDQQRTVSTVGNEFRIVRKHMAHMHDFTIDEAFRASDFAVRLLDHFGDAEGFEEARRIRHEALAALAAHEGVTGQVAAETASLFASSARQSLTPLAEKKTESVAPHPEVFVREPSVIGDKRIKFESWIVVQVGGVDMLDELPKKVAKEKVRAVAAEIATYEGPIHLDRHTDKTAQSFGLQRVRSEREKKISCQIQQAGLSVDENKFVWPREIEPATWSEFRPNDSAAERPFIHTSPVEIANAARFIAAKHPDISAGDLDVAILQTSAASAAPSNSQPTSPRRRSCCDGFSAGLLKQRLRTCAPRPDLPPRCRLSPAHARLDEGYHAGRSGALRSGPRLVEPPVRMHVRA